MSHQRQSSHYHFLDGVFALVVIILWGIEALRDIEGQRPVTCPEYRAVSITTNLAKVAEQVENYLRKSARSIIALGTLLQAISLYHHRSCVGICHARCKYNDTVDALHERL